MKDKILELFEDLIEKFLGWFVGPFRGDLDTLHTLIYGSDKRDLYYGIFDEKQFGVVAQGMAVMQSLSVGIILISIILAGMRIASSGINPSNRTYSLEYFKDFVIVALLFFNLSTIFEFMFTVNSMFVTTFDAAKTTMDGDVFDKMGAFTEKGPLGALVIGLVLLGLWIWANFYYMMRTLTLMLLTIMSPLAVALYLIPQTKAITGGLFKEYAGTVFVQSVHAALYWVVSSVAGADFGLGSVLLYIIFIPLSESIRGLLGLGGQMNDRLSKTAAMFGGSALMGVIGSVKGALNGQTVAQSLRGAAGQAIEKGIGRKGGVDAEDSKGLLAGAGTDIGSTSRAERMLKAGEILSKGGKAVFGAAGAIAGSPMGPMGSITGSTIGFSTGGVVGGVAGRTGMAGAEIVGNRVKAGAIAGWNKFKGVKNAESLADEKLANTLADEETTKWASANKESFMKDIKERFPDITDAARNQMWDKEVASKNSEFLQDAKKHVSKIKTSSGQQAKSSELVDATVKNLTNDWASKNKDAFMRDYDANYPLPANATEGDILKHNQNKKAAWQQAVSNKKDSISNIANNAASKLGFGTSPVHSLVNKEDFAKEIGNQVGSVLGIGSQEGLLAVKGATNASGKLAKPTELVNATVKNLTNDWASKNKNAFMRDYDANYPLPANATEGDILKHNQNKTVAWQQAVSNKRDSISNIANNAASKLGFGTSPVNSLVNKEDFAKEIGNQVGSVLGIGSQEGLLAVKGATNASGKQAKPTELVNATVKNLTNDWASKNKNTFMGDYDANYPLPANATEGDILKHNQNKKAAWQQAVSNKRDSISNIANNAVSKLGFNTPSNAFVNKEDFAKEVGNQIGSVLGMGGREGQLAVKGATSAVKNASLYSSKSVNTDVLTNQLAALKTNEAKEAFIQDRITNGSLTNKEALQEWEQTKAPALFRQNLSKLSSSPSNGGIPKHIPLDHAIIGNSVVRGAGAVVSGVASASIATSGIKEVSSFLGDTKLGHGAKSFVVGTKHAWANKDPMQNPVTALAESAGQGAKFGWSEFKGHVADNVVGKQVGFKNAVAYTTGIIGGVRGYKAGATYASGGPQNTKTLGLKGFNPYNNAVNNQVAEISEIQQMVETVQLPNGQTAISAGAIRMATTAGRTIIQVRDKSGQVQTVSRIASGDPSLKKGETIYQDFTIQDGQFAPTSNVYSEDSGGGKIQSTKTINVNPNKIIANRNSSKNPRVVKEVQSYNQLVDSGQYYLNDAMKEMSDIQMVVDRNRSYLVGSKEGKQYRISPYGAGDARLNEETEIIRNCEVRNRQLIVSPTDEYTSSIQPKDLVPKAAPNKRNLLRRQNEQMRNKTLTESLGR
ncbi:hypothetical protein FAY30_26525 (plasmid) [Bacillus sp. S3]|uniref:hypothetical protein n=1 Tax=Bacillus sp. S3 TaxID=486398 RepID=UPI001188D8CF|nr:hypothetical protein [Bacillus sp. S3]QCJ45497.1 hypothetical protein FAY30_26525 [Bacillus sp. S3]